MKLVIKKIDESKIIKNKFKVNVSFYLGTSNYHEEDFYFKTEADVIEFYNALLSECNCWVDNDDIKHPELKEGIQYIIEEMGLCSDLRYDDNVGAFSVSWFNENGLEHRVEVIKD